MWEQTSYWSFDQQSPLSASFNRSWLVLHGCSLLRKTAGTQNYEKLRSNTCERTQSNHKKHAEDSSYPKGIEVMLRETARKSYPENDDNPMLAPRDHDVRQSGRALGASEQRSLDPTNRSILALSYPLDYSWVVLQKLSWKVTCEFGSQGRSQAKNISICIGFRSRFIVFLVFASFWATQVVQDVWPCFASS